MIKKILIGLFSTVLLLNVTGCGESENTPAVENSEEVPPDVQEAVDQVIAEVEAEAETNAPANPQ